jgi:inositol transport system substrate-binding protein
MKKIALAALATTMLTSGFVGAAQAETVGVTMAAFDDNFLTVLRNGMHRLRQATLDGVELQVEDAQNDVPSSRARSRTSSRPASDAIIVNPVDTDATAAPMSKLAADAGIPLVYVNRQPVNIDDPAGKPGFRGLGTKSFRHAGNQGSLPPADRGRQGQ